MTCWVDTSRALNVVRGFCMFLFFTIMQHIIQTTKPHIPNVTKLTIVTETAIVTVSL